MKPRVFIASSVEGLPWAQAIQENLERVAEPTIWSQAFELTEDVLSQLLAIVSDVDFAVFVLTPDDTATVRNEKHEVVRDNIVFELGISLSQLGKPRTFVVLPHRTPRLHLPSDLAGLVPATFDPDRSDLPAALGPASTKIERAIAKHAFRRRSGLYELVPHSAVNWASLIDGADDSLRAYGFGLANIADVNRRRIVDRIKNSKRFKATIILADPLTSAAAMRVEDEDGNLLALPDIAKITLRLIADRDEELKPLRKEKRLQILQFGGYPTLAAIAIDADLYVYPYTYSQLGTNSPVLVLRNYRVNPFAQVFDRHLAQIEAAAFPPEAGRLRKLITPSPALKRASRAVSTRGRRG